MAKPGALIFKEMVRMLVAGFCRQRLIRQSLVAAQCHSDLSYRKHDSSFEPVVFCPSIGPRRAVSLAYGLDDCNRR